MPIQPGRIKLPTVNPEPCATSTLASAPGAAHAARPDRHTRAGVLYGVAAYGAWGLFPVYFKAIRQVPALEVLCHRVIWSLAFLILLMLARHNWRTASAALRSRRTLATLCLTTGLIACNWLVFIWSVANNYLLQASLGYFINPLVNVLLGFVFLGERLRRGQTASVVLAGAGVAYLTIACRQPPTLALVLAATFGLYGLLRKTVKADALVGLTVETTLLAPLAVAYLGYEMARGRAVFASGLPRMDVLLLLAGVITAVPLLWFAGAARRLRLTTLGFLQYLAPSGQFLLATLAYHEPFTRAHVVAFGCIWTALAIFSLDALTRARPATAAQPVAPPE